MGNRAPDLQRMTESCRRQAEVLTITSGKGGVGKSNIAANLAVCLACSQKRIVLLDADLSLGNLDVIMGFRSRYNISHMLDGKKCLEDIIHIGPGGVEVICSTSGLERLANLNEFQRQRLLRELSKLQENSDAIIIDTAGGICRSVVGFCLAADHVLVVTTPEATAITDAYAMIKVLVRNSFGGRISLVVNMADTVAEGRRTYQQIAGVAMRFLNAHIYGTGVILKDERLASAIRLKKPVVLAYPKAKISSSLSALAAKLGNGLAAQPYNEGFFRKVVNWFS